VGFILNITVKCFIYLLFENYIVKTEEEFLFVYKNNFSSLCEELHGMYMNEF